ncbi:MAG TPA: neutral zinc metallopeptidase [Mycobacteriales bacterium]|jgi:predicted metalloprotease|nr:neutral zinc metallopeptidase [Mycobacteriales bacterium]
MRLARLIGRRLIGVLLGAVVISGCTVRPTGHGSVAGTLPSALCPKAELDAGSLVDCVSADVSTFWTNRLHRPINEPLFVDPRPAAVPRACRPFLSFGTAFFCTNNSTVYLTHKAVTRDQKTFGIFLPWALATIVSHEIGHVVQQAVQQPGFDSRSDAVSRKLEQQADCLSGVWAYAKVKAGQLDAAGFRLTERRELEAVSSLPTPGDLSGYNEVRTHGTVAERVAALSKGLASGDPASCDLAKPLGS